MNKNYQGSVRFIDDESLLTESFGMTGDIVFVIVPGKTTTTEKYVKASSTTSGALKVVANDADPFDSTTQIKIGDVSSDVEGVEVGDYVVKKEISTTTPATSSAAYVKLDKEWIAFPTA